MRTCLREEGNRLLATFAADRRAARRTTERRAKQLTLASARMRSRVAQQESTLRTLGAYLDSSIV